MFGRRFCLRRRLRLRNLCLDGLGLRSFRCNRLWRRLGLSSRVICNLSGAFGVSRLTGVRLRLIPLASGRFATPSTAATSAFFLRLLFAGLSVGFRCFLRLRCIRVSLGCLAGVSVLLSVVAVLATPSPTAAAAAFFLGLFVAVELWRVGLFLFGQRVFLDLIHQGRVH